jgi:hypothetical protein
VQKKKKPMGNKNGKSQAFTHAPIRQGAVFHLRSGKIAAVENSLANIIAIIVQSPPLLSGGVELGVVSLQSDAVALALICISSLVVRACTHLSRNVTIESAEVGSVWSTARPAMCTR